MTKMSSPFLLGCIAAGLCPGGDLGSEVETYADIKYSGA